MNLYPHQAKALEETEGQNRVAFYHDMGLGKTFTGSEKMMSLGGAINLVICQKSKIDDWVEHFLENYWNINVCNMTTKRGFEAFLNPTWAVGTHIGVINYDLIFRRPELLKIKYDTVMLDESSLIQNRTSKRSKAILKLDTRNVILLSGTPTGGRYERLWSQVKLLGWNISEELFFKQYVVYHYEDDEGFPRRVIDGYKNVDRLKAKLRQHGANFLKTEEVIDLPEQVFQEIRVPVTSTYKNFVKSRIVTIKKKSDIDFSGLAKAFGVESVGPAYEEIELVGDTSLTYDLYKRMLCGAYNPNKLEAFGDILESTDDRLIVFYNWNDELDELLRICDEAERPTSVVNGQTKDLTNYESCENSVTLIQYQAGSMGLNLQKSNKIVYFTPPTMSELFEQSKKRTHRIGQEQTCFYYMIICNGSVEERIYRVLKERRDYTEALFEE